MDRATKPKDQATPVFACALGVFAMVLVAGCGTTKTRLATEQLLVSDAVDQAVGDIDFSAMSGQKVFFDAQYINNIKGIGFVNSEYIISSLRQQMVAADCRLQDSEDDADFVVEARVGTLGTNAHEIVYGVPANSALSAAADLMPNTPALPAIPELALAKRDTTLGAAKIAVFAYERESRRPVWQSGTSKAKSIAQDYWVFGAGPFQRGNVYDGTQFAGNRIRMPQSDDDETSTDGPSITYGEPFYFPRAKSSAPNGGVSVVGYEEGLPPVVLGPMRPSDSEPIRSMPRPRERPDAPPRSSPPPSEDPSTTTNEQ
ncbi:MAG: DUF6655 family protein [Planctomycetota bacterium]